MRTAVAVLILIAACQPDDECHDGEAQCVDGTAMNCMQTHDNQPFIGGPNWRWVKGTCTDGTTCAIAAGRAVCPLSTTPDPECPGPDVNAGCESSELVWWQGCLPITIQDCPFGCLEPMSTPTCNNTDAQCAPVMLAACTGVRGACADADTLIECNCGGEFGRLPCPLDQHCVSVPAPVGAICQ